MDHKHNHKTTYTTITMISLAAVFVTSFVLNERHVFAESFEVYVSNKLTETLIFNEVENRQDVQKKSDPPEEISSGETGQFKIATGDSGKSPHLKVQYYVGEKGSDETVTFGLKGDTWLDISCFTETSSSTIQGKVNDCGSNDDFKYTFSPK